MKKSLPLLTVFIALLFATCDRDWDNPFHDKNTLDPEAWAPENLQIETVSITERQLTWSYNGHPNIEGFKLDRKKGDEPWQAAFASLPTETRTWNDTTLIPEDGLTYQYRLYAFAGNNSSAEKTTSTEMEFPAPTDLAITKLSEISYKLEWTDNSVGEQGFKIDRRLGDEEWKIAFATLPENQTAFTDTNVFAGKSELNLEYRVYAFYKEFESAKTNANTNVALTPPADLTITKNTITSVTLNWHYDGDGIDGFKIERKYEGGNWDEVAVTTGSSWQDNVFELNTIVHYRISAYYNQHISPWVENSFDATMPAPENLTIAATSATSVTLNWSYGFTGHEGFRIERKIDNGSWVVLVGNLNPGQTNSTDSGINLNSHNYQYRINAFFGQFESQQIVFPEIPFLCGILNIIDSRDGNTYQTVQIGNQCWMKENLKWLPSVSPSANGSNTSPYYYVYGYQGTGVSGAKATINYQTYGVLYNWPAALNACPDGWHLPTDNEWTILTDYLGGSSVAGGKMKTTGTTHWNSPNTGATNASGFSGLPGGYRDSDGSFDFLGYDGHWWSSSEYSSTDAWFRYLNFGFANAYRYNYNKELGFSVRCVRD